MNIKTAWTGMDRPGAKGLEVSLPENIDKVYFQILVNTRKQDRNKYTTLDPDQWVEVEPEFNGIQDHNPWGAKFVVTESLFKNCLKEGQFMWKVGYTLRDLDLC